MSKKKKTKLNTSLVHAGRNKKFTNGAVNIPPYRSSTVLFETLEEYNHGTMIIRILDMADWVLQIA